MGRLGMLLAAGLALAGCTNDGAPETGDATRASALHRDGLYLRDAQDRVVVIHGVNAVWKHAPYAPPATAEGFTAADADWLAAHGFNAVRLGVLFAGVMPQPDIIDHAYLEQIDRVVQLLAARRIYVLLDFHQDAYSERFAGEGFPDWAVHDDGLPFFNTQSFFANYFTPAVARAFDNLWADVDQLWDRYAAAWTAVALRWRHQPYLLGYDLINEPAAGSQQLSCVSPAGCPLFDATLQAFHDHVRAAIRRVDREHIVWYEPQLLFQLPFGRGNFTAVDDPQIGLSWHDYACTGALFGAVGLPAGPDCPIGENMVMDKADAQAGAMGATSLLTEFGASDDVADTARMVALADDHRVGWTYWAYKFWNDPTTTGAGHSQSMFEDDADLSTVKPEKLRALERAYPQAIAGTPLAWSFDPDSGDFDLAYTPAAGGARTEIYVPVATHYPGGYRVDVSGGQVRSAANAPRLLVENAAGAAEVHVSIRKL